MRRYGNSSAVWLNTNLCSPYWYVCVQCRVYSAQCRVYSAECTVYSAECRVYSVQCTVQSVQCTVQSAECTVQSAECTVYSAECRVYSAQCRVQRKLDNEALDIIKIQGVPVEKMKKTLFHHQIGLKCKEEATKLLYLERSFVWC